MSSESPDYSALPQRTAGLVLLHNTMNITVRPDALLAAHKRLIEGMKTGDADVILSLYADDIVLMPPNDTSIFGKAEAEQWVREYLQHFRITDVAVTDRPGNMGGENDAT